MAFKVGDEVFVRGLGLELYKIVQVQHAIVQIAVKSASGHQYTDWFRKSDIWKPKEKIWDGREGF